jgi:hypothetical protein
MPRDVLDLDDVDWVPAFEWQMLEWSTGPELNRRILVLQTSALATSPPVLISLL